MKRNIVMPEPDLLDLIDLLVKIDDNQEALDKENTENSKNTQNCFYKLKELRDSIRRHIEY